MKKLLEYLTSSIAKNPKDIVITEEGEGNFLNLTLKVHPDDIKLIIGKNGRTIKALRELLRIKAIKKGKLVNLIIKESKE